MAKQTINIGTSANDGTGSTLRAAFDICNDNFTELYDGSGGLLHKIEGTNFTGSLLIGHSTTGTLSAAIKNTGVGLLALDALTSGDSNTAIGYNAGSSINSGSYNTMLGSQAGDALTTGGENVAIGFSALSAEDTAHFNIAIGSGALGAQNSDSSSPYNIAIGHAAGASVSTGVRNLIIGAFAGDALTIGNFNTAIGYSALSTSVDGDANIAIGYQALTNYEGNDGEGGNVAIGFQAGENVSTGNSNTLIGFEAGDALTTGSNNIIIGNGAAASAVDVSNEVTIGNSSVANVRIPSDSTLKIGASDDLQIEHVSSNSFIKNTAVGDLYIENQVDDKDIIFRSDDGSGGLATYFKIDGSGTTTVFHKDIRFDDSVLAKFGADSDLRIYHDSSNSYIENNTNDLIILNNANDKDIVFQCDDDSGGVTTYLRLDGSTKTLDIPDSIPLAFGDSDDFKISHSGGATNIINETGHITIQQRLDDGDIVFQCDDGSGGLTDYLRIDGSATNTKVYKDMRFLNNVDAQFGTNGDFKLYHDSSNMYLEMVNSGAGDIIIQNANDDKDIRFKSDDGSGGLAEYFRVDGGDERVLFSKQARFLDNADLKIGTSGDLSLSHDGSNTRIQNFTGALKIIQNADDGDIEFFSDDGSGGITEYFRLDGGNVNMITSVNNVFIDDKKLVLGSSADLEIFHQNSSGNSFIQNNTGNLRLIQNTDDGDITFESDNGSGGTTEYFRVDGSSENVLFSKIIKLSDNVELRIGDGNDIKIVNDGSNSYIRTGTDGGDLIIEQNQDDKDIIFKCDDGSGGVEEYFRLDGSAAVVVASKEFRFADNVPMKLGNGPDFQMLHNGTTTSFENSTGNLKFTNFDDDSDIIFQTDDGSGGTTPYITLDGSEVRTIFARGARFNDSIPIELGGSADAQIQHDGTDTKFVNATGDLILQNSADDKDINFLCDDGSGGTATYFRVDGSEVETRFLKSTLHFDSVQAKFGDSGDFKIYHDGSNSYLNDIGTGNLIIAGQQVYITNAAGNEYKAQFTTDGAVNLYYDNSKKFETTNTGVKTTGQMDLAALNSAPSSASDTGTVGEIRFTADYIYVCVASNTWKRAALSTW